ncbi:hypothetical protein FXO37_18962 [Capsicum annuum]|nr:hypothetical protein FXO37_18962 [Capsicum annuum]
MEEVNLDPIMWTPSDAFGVYGPSLLDAFLGPRGDSCFSFSGERTALNVLYDMVGDATKGSFGEGCSTSHIKHFGFSSCKLIMHVVNDVLKVYMLGFGVQDGNPRGPPIKKEVGLARPYDVGQERILLPPREDHHIGVVDLPQGFEDRVLTMKWEHGLQRVDSLPGRGSDVGVELMEVTFAVKSIEEGLCKFPMTDGLFSWEMKGFALKLSLGEDFPHFGGVPVWAWVKGSSLLAKREGPASGVGLEVRLVFRSVEILTLVPAMGWCVPTGGNLRSYPFSGDRFHLKVTVFQGSASSEFGFTSCDVGGVGEAFGWLDWTWKLL